MFFFCLVFAMPLCASVYMCLVVTLGQVWYLIVSISDLCTLTYFKYFTLTVDTACLTVLASFLVDICIVEVRM